MSINSRKKKMRRGNGKDRKKNLRNVNKSREQDAETQQQSNVDHTSEHLIGDPTKRFDESNFSHPLTERTNQKEEDFEPIVQSKEKTFVFFSVNNLSKVRQI